MKLAVLTIWLNPFFSNHLIAIAALFMVSIGFAVESLRHVT